MDDIRPLITRFDHPTLHSFLVEAGFLSVIRDLPYERWPGRALSAEELTQIVGMSPPPPNSTPLQIIESANGHLYRGGLGVMSPSVAKKNVSVAPPAVPASTVANARAAMLEGLSVAELKEQLRANDLPVSGNKSALIQRLMTPKPSTSGSSRPVPEATAAPVRAPQTSSPERSEDVLTTQRINLNIDEDRIGFGEEGIQLPAIAPVLLYALVMLTVAGTMVADGAPLSVGLALGLGMALFVPLLVPSQPVLTQLAGISAIGWLVVLLAGSMGIEAQDGPGVLSPILSVGFSSMLLTGTLAVLSIGTASFAEVEPERRWSRQSANAVTCLALVLMVAAAVSEAARAELGPLVGAVAGLWGILVLGQARPIRLDRLPDVMALLALGFAMISVQSSWESDVFIFLVLMLLICGGALLAPNIPREETASILLLASGIGMVLLSWLVTGGTLANAVLHGLVFGFIVALMEIRYRQMAPKEQVVRKVLAPGSAPNGALHNINNDIGILGFKETGKTSFLAGLWLLLDHHLVRDLWYGSARWLHDDRPLPFETTDLRELLKEAAQGMAVDMLEHADEREILAQYLDHRQAKQTMKEEFRQGRLPHANEGFPFVAEADRSTRTFLEGFSSQLALRDRRQRRVPDSTGEVSQDLILKLGFGARVEHRQPTWFGLFERRQEKVMHVQSRIRCRDLPGEEVQRAVEFMDGKEISQTSISALLRAIEQRQEFGKHKHAIRYVVEMMARFPQILFVVDANKFTSADRDRNSPVKSFLMLADKLSKLSGARVKQVTVLLNKADELLLRGEEAKRTMPNGGLRQWSDLKDRDLAKMTLEEVVGPAVMRSLSLPVEAYFTCTFGGLIARGVGEKAAQQIPTFPMVPIHVLEPILRTMMDDDEAV